MSNDTNTNLTVGQRVRVNRYPYPEPGAVGTIVKIDPGRPFGLDYLVQPDDEPDNRNRSRTYHAADEIEILDRRSAC